MARATWDTGWFQAEVYRELFHLLGYRVDGPVTMENQQFYDAVAAGEVDLWVNGWFPLHESLVAPDDPVSLVGTQVDSGVLQGYFRRPGQRRLSPFSMSTGAGRWADREEERRRPSDPSERR